MNTINSEIIDKIVTSIIQKCSNKDIKEKLSRLSQEEKSIRLEDKLNGFEKKNYELLLTDLQSCIDKAKQFENDSTNQDYYNTMVKNSKIIEDAIFDYEKRIYRGYDLNRNRMNLPEYNINDYQEDKQLSPEDNSTNLGDIEKLQIDKQSEVLFNEDEKAGLKNYFHNDSTMINMDLDHNYSSGWDSMDSDEQIEIHESCKDKIKSIDSAMNKTEGLLENTILYTGVQHSNIVGIHTLIGDKVNMKSFISASFQENVGKSYGSHNYEGVYTHPELPKLYVKFLAPKGTKGVCANDSTKNLTKFSFEHEYLLSRNQTGTVVDIDYDTGCITVLLNE